LDRKYLNRLQIGSIAIAIAFSGSGCYNRGKKTEPTPTPSAIEAQLSLSDLSLSQVDKTGKPAWKIRAEKGVYTPDRKKAKVTNLQGELYQDGQIAIRLTAKSGEVEQDGQKVILRGDVVATETKNSLVLSGQEVEWQPNEDLLTIRDRVRAVHPKVQTTAQQGTYRTRSAKVELSGNIQAVYLEPSVYMQTEKLTWLVNKSEIIGDRPVQLQQYQAQKIIATASANGVSSNVDRQIIRLNGDVRANNFDPPIVATTESVIWTLPTQIITANRPIQIVHKQEQATFNGDRGEVNLAAKTATLSGRARGIATRNRSQLQAEKLIWQMTSQQIIATGSVAYQQTNPEIKFTGTRGVGKLQDQSIVVTSDNSRGVQTEIDPEKIGESSSPVPSRSP
jgi:LPS export ABC transporter protein LptC